MLGTAFLCLVLTPLNHSLANSAGLSASPSAAASAAATISLSIDDRDALARVAYAEAGNQGRQGIAAVVFTILNRVASGKFQNGVQAVVSEPYQFEPVTHAGSWRKLPPLSPGNEAEFDRILAAIGSGQLTDPTGGALYFQNRAIVAARAAAGLVPASLIDFGGQPAIAEIGDHRFYRNVGYLGKWRAGAGRRSDAAQSGWGVALGAFPAEFRALRAIELVKVAVSLPENVGQSTAVRLKDGKVYGALLVGLREDVAASTCASVRRTGAYCVKLAPAELGDPDAAWRG
jgi:Cell Wall Hydrolase